VVDSQSVKTTGVGGEQRGYDGGKKVKGRKRHLLVDTQGLVLKAKVHSANIQDRQGIKLLLEPASTGLTRLSHLWLDAGYTGQDKGAGWVERVLGWSAEIVRHPPKPAPEEVMMRWMDEVDEGVCQRGRGTRPEEALATGGPQAVFAEEVGGGAHVLVVGPEQEAERRLRAAARDRRSLHLRGDEPPDGEAFGPLMRVFGQFHREVRILGISRKFAFKGFSEVRLFLGTLTCFVPQRTYTPLS
jgi:transposase